MHFLRQLRSGLSGRRNRRRVSKRHKGKADAGSGDIRKPVVCFLFLLFTPLSSICAGVRSSRFLNGSLVASQRFIKLLEMQFFLFLTQAQESVDFTQKAVSDLVRQQISKLSGLLLERL